MGLSGSAARYEVTDERLLPKFSPRKNPFRATIHPHEKSESEAPSAEPIATAEPAVPVAVKPAEPEQSEPAAAPAPNAPVALQREMPFVAHVTRVRSWPRRIWESLSRWKPRMKRAPRQRAAGLGPVQRELCLDMVRVVRSDLTDCDVVTPAPTPTPVKTSAGRRALQRGTGAVLALERTARELFGAQRVERR